MKLPKDFWTVLSLSVVFLALPEKYQKPVIDFGVSWRDAASRVVLKTLPEGYMTQVGDFLKSRAIAAFIAGVNALPLEYKTPVIDFLESLNDGPGVCGTLDCRKTARLYAKSMNKDVHPCSDFYKFSCGRTAEISPPIPEGAMQLNRLHLLPPDIENLRQVMLQSAIKDADILPIQQAKKFYQSCMDTDARKSRGIKTIASMLKSNGGWPMAMNIGDWRKNVHSWQEIDEKFTNLGADHAFYHTDLRIKEIPDGSRPYEFTPIHCIILHAPRDDHLPEFRENYTEYRSTLRAVVEAFIRENQADVFEELLERDIRELFVFEKKLHEVINSSSNSSSIHQAPIIPNVHGFLQGWFAEMSPWGFDDRNWIDLSRVIQRLFDVKEIGEIRAWPVSFEDTYYQSLTEILAATDERTIVNYVHWKFVNQILNSTTEEIQKELSVFKERPSNLTRLQQCRKETEMIHAEVFWFAENHFGEDIEEAAGKIARNVEKELIHQIENSSWLSDDGKAALIWKLGRIKMITGVNDWHRNRTAVEYHYEGLTIGDDYVANILSFRKYKKKSALSTFVDREKYTSWRSALQAAPSYEGERNIINIQAAFLQWPFFGSNLPNYVNYGITGYTIGHELGHSIDAETIGLKRYNRTSILRPAMLNEAQKQFSCIREYFSNHYSNKSIADQTLREDLCDLIGIRSSLDAYKRLRQNEERKLLGLGEFTDEQMFFLSYSQFHCGVRVPGSEDNWSDSHSPAEFRVNGAVSNTPEFAEAFNCPLGSPMNPAAKCSVWSNMAPVPKPSV